ncbi:hypothetical protein [uncultured Flavobacterium sp.]|uniref:hypothetical protein n=1 Tax=uncultured Flavobacterium sp. TaxID=165435 RepID=UPI0030817B8F
MRVFILIFILSLFSCNQKQETISKEKKTISNKIINDKERSYSKNKEYVIGQIYNGSIINFGGLRVNYGFGKYIFNETNEDYLIDSTVVQSKNIKLEEILFRPEDYAGDLIKIRDFTYGLIKSKGILSMGLLKKEKNYNWKCVDAKEVEKVNDTSEYPSELGNGKVFSFICETSEGHFCCGVVINKINSSGKYTKVLKAYKFDLGNEKIVEIDLKKEKVECEPEAGEE